MRSSELAWWFHTLSMFSVMEIWDGSCFVLELAFVGHPDGDVMMAVVAEVCV